MKSVAASKHPPDVSNSTARMMPLSHAVCLAQTDGPGGPAKPQPSASLLSPKRLLVDPALCRANISHRQGHLQSEDIWHQPEIQGNLRFSYLQPEETRGGGPACCDVLHHLLLRLEETFLLLHLILFITHAQFVFLFTDLYFVQTIKKLKTYYEYTME